jgi:hypothetical protein
VPYTSNSTFCHTSTLGCLPQVGRPVVLLVPDLPLGTARVPLRPENLLRQKPAEGTEPALLVIVDGRFFSAHACRLHALLPGQFILSYPARLLFPLASAFFPSLSHLHGPSLRTRQVGPLPSCNQRLDCPPLVRILHSSYCSLALSVVNQNKPPRLFFRRTLGQNNFNLLTTIPHQIPPPRGPGTSQPQPWLTATSPSTAAPSSRRRTRSSPTSSAAAARSSRSRSARPSARRTSPSDEASAPATSDPVPLWAPLPTAMMTLPLPRAR